MTTVREDASLPGGAASRRMETRGLETRTKAVEEALAPLIAQITELNAERPRSHSGKPPKVSKLVHIVEKATKNFIAVGEQIASENSDFQEELLLACDEVKAAGEVMHQAALEFSRNTLESEYREAMVTASQRLLTSVAKLLVVVDAVDIKKMFKTSSQIEAKLHRLYSVRSEEELMRTIRECTPDITRVTQLATHRQKELKSETAQQLLAAAQTQLNQTSRILITSSKTLLQFPSLASAEANKNYVVSRMVEALKAIAELADGENPANIHFLPVGEKKQRLEQCFEELESLLHSSTSLDPTDYPTHQGSLKGHMEAILAEAGKLLLFTSTPDYRQHSIITLSSNLKRKMQKLFGAFVALASAGGGEGGEGGEGVRGEGDGDDGQGDRGGGKKLEKEVVVGERVTEVVKTVKDLKKELSHAVMDHLSDAFLHPLGPVERMEGAAMAGKERLARERAQSFARHTEQMERVAQLICSLSRDSYGIRTTQFVTNYITTLSPQVILAAQTLAAHPRSHLAQRNMLLFREAWVENVQLLQDSVEALVSLVDFMTVVEVHIREDSQKFVQAMENGDSKQMRKTLQLVRGRSMQLIRMVQEDVVENSRAYNQGQLPRLEATARALREKSLPWFCDLGFRAADTLYTTRDPHTINKKALEEAAQKVNEHVWELRRTVLLARGEWEGDLDSEVQSPGFMSPIVLSQESTISLGGTVSPNGKFERTPQHSGVFEHRDSARAVMASLSPDQQAELAKEAEGLSEEHSRFETEVNRWSDSGHDIIIIAKEMCHMMLDMSDFTRGLGQLKTTMDVIITAKDIARAGEYLDFVTRPLAEKCPNEQHRRDLLAHLDRLRLHTRQLKITSSVKAELNTSSKETVDSASAMISAARNLMSTVALVVRVCYLASTAIARAEGTIPEEVVQWRLESPKQKELTPEPSGESLQTYREKRKSDISPSAQLEEFRSESRAGGNSSGRGGGGGEVEERREEEGRGGGGRRGGGRGWSSGRRGRGVGGGVLESIPEVSSSTHIHQDSHDGTYF